MPGNTSPSNVPAKRPEFGRLEARKLAKVVNKAELLKATKSLEDRLIDFGMEGFSEPAASALSQNLTIHYRQIGEGAISIAKRDGLDSVSEDHIKRAETKLRRADSPLWKSLLSILGGALLGTAIQEVVGIVNSDDPLDKLRVIITMGLLVAGVLAVSIAVIPRNKE